MSGYSLGSRRGKFPRVLVAIMVVFLVVLVAVVVGVRQYYVRNLQPVGSTSTSQLVTVEQGASAKQIAAMLKKDGLIRDATVFEWYVRNHNLRDKLQAGSYYLRPNMSVSEIAGVLTQGKVATDLFTILPGQRLDQIKKAFVKAGYSQADVDAAFNPELYADHPALVDKPAGASLEGYLYPDSFQKTASTKPETIIRQSLDLMQKHLTPEVRAGFVKQGLTVHQGVIIASIVEQEVSNPADRPIVAQVFLKRLRIGMELGSDVTAFYGATIAGQTPSVEYDSPYNTRLHAGLPPGPISNVSDTSLRAVAFPASTDYLYFVAGDDGKTYFSTTLEEHQQNTRLHCIKLCS